MSRFTFQSVRSHSGSALIISLVLLLVITIIGLSGVQSTQLQMKMVGSVQDRNVAFGLAEAALALVERELIDNPPLLSDFALGCSGANCFTTSCNKGRCFAGSYDAAQGPSSCVVATSRSTEPWRTRDDFWEDRNNPEYAVRNISGLRDGFENDDGVNLRGALTDEGRAKIIIDFMCFTPASDDVPLSVNNAGAGIASNGGSLNSFAPLVRITAYAEGTAQRSEVLLQSTLRLAVFE